MLSIYHQTQFLPGFILSPSQPVSADPIPRLFLNNFRTLTDADVKLGKTSHVSICYFCDKIMEFHPKK